MNINKGLAATALLPLILALPLPADAQSTDSGTGELEEIVVKGIRAAIDDAIASKRNANTISDSISATDIGKLPDQNVSETLSRIPGVQVTRVEGEGAKINVRGIDLNRTQLNGRNFIGASNNGDPNLADFPAEILASVDVIKAPTADLPEGWLGAIINLKTLRPLDLSERLFSARAAGSYGDKGQELGGKVSAAIGDTFDDGRLGLLVSGTYSSFTGRSDSFQTRGWSEISGIPASGPGAGAARIFRPNRFEQYAVEYQTDRYGLNATLQWQPNDNLIMTLDAITSKSDTERTRNVTQYIFPGTITDANVLADGTLNQATVSGVTARPLVMAGPSENDAQAYAATLDFNFGAWDVRMSSSRSTGTSDGGNDGNSQQSTSYPGQDYIPVVRQVAGNELSVAYDFNRSTISPEFSVDANYDFDDMSLYEVFFMVDFTNLIDNDGFDFDFDIYRPLDSGILSSVQFGARYEDASVFSKQDRISYSNAQFMAGDPTPGTSLRANETTGLSYGGSVSDFMNGAGHGFPTTLIRGTHDIEAFRSHFNGVPTADDLATTASGTLDVEQETLAGYVRLDFEGDIGAWSYGGNVGVRYVTSDRKSSGFDRVDSFIQPRSVTREFDDTLPTFNLRLSPTDSFYLRLAAAKVIARPPLSLTGVGLRIQPTIGTGTAGNPALDPFSATQFDLSAEWYFDTASMLSLALFRKDVSAFTTTVQTIEDHPEIMAPGLPNTTFTISRPANGSDGQIDGVEFNYYHAFTFLPAPFDGLGVNLSYTHVDSETPNTDELTGAVLPLPNLSDDSYNIVGYYEDDRLNIRLAYNFRSEYLLAQQPAALGGSPYHDERGQLDATTSYQLSDRYQLTLDAINLTQEERSLYTGTRNRLTTSWQDDRRFYLGLAGKF